MIAAVPRPYFFGPLEHLVRLEPLGVRKVVLLEDLVVKADGMVSPLECVRDHGEEQEHAGAVESLKARLGEELVRLNLRHLELVFPVELPRLLVAPVKPGCLVSALKDSGQERALPSSSDSSRWVKSTGWLLGRLESSDSLELLCWLESSSRLEFSG